MPFSFCDPFCRKGDSCFGANASLYDRCMAGCSAETTKMRVDALSAIGRCVSEQTCELFGSEAYWPACIDAVEPKIAPSQVDIDYCHAISPARFECGAPIAIARCINDTKLWSDATLSTANACTINRTSCDALLACTTLAFTGAD